MCFLLGVLAAFIGFKLARRHGVGWHRGHRRFGPGAAFHRRMERKWRKRAVERMADWLDATPEQARVIADEAGSLFDQGKAMKRQVHGFRKVAADALRAEPWDRSGVDEALGAQEQSFAAFRQRIGDGLQRLRDVLDAEQRAELASLLEHGPHRRCHGAR